MILWFLQTFKKLLKVNTHWVKGNCENCWLLRRALFSNEIFSPLVHNAGGQMIRYRNKKNLPSLNLCVRFGLRAGGWRKREIFSENQLHLTTLMFNLLAPRNVKL